MAVNLYASNKRDDGDFVYLESDFDGDVSGKLWFRVEKSLADYLHTDTLDSFVLPMLLICMERGVDLVVHGKMSEKLYENIRLPLINILAGQTSQRKKINLYCENLSFERNVKSKGSATGLSCGIDSYAAIYTNYYNKLNSLSKITHLTYFNHSANSHRVERNPKVAQHKKIAEILGLPLYFVDTNFNSHISMPHIMNHTILNSAAAMVLCNLIGSYYYSSTYQYKSLMMGEVTDIAYIDPIILSLIGNNRIDFYSTGSEFSRVEKTENITNLPVTFDYLEVCPKNPDKQVNCGHCYKCLRTLITLDLLGKVELYDKSFDIPSYFRYRKGHINKLIRTRPDNALTIEILSMPGALEKLSKWTGKDINKYWEECKLNK